MADFLGRIWRGMFHDLPHVGEHPGYTAWVFVLSVAVLHLLRGEIMLGFLIAFAVTALFAVGAIERVGFSEYVERVERERREAPRG